MVLIGSVTLLSALFFIMIIGMAIKARKRPVVTGAEELLHETGIALKSFDHHGHVQLHGETWQAESHKPVSKGAPIRVTERDRLNADVQKILDAQTDVWGIKVANVEIKHFDLDESMIRAIAKQAEAERERRAKIIHARGEMQAAEKLVEAAEMLAKQPQAIQLRYLQTLTEIAGDKSSTIVFPLPMDLITPLLKQDK